MPLFSAVARSSPARALFLQGLGKRASTFSRKSSAEFDMPIITEIMDAHDLNLFDDVDILQVGRETCRISRCSKSSAVMAKPVLLKRGMSATIDELLMSAEYIMSEGNDQVMLCERGIRTFETRTRNYL